MNARFPEVREAGLSNVCRKPAFCNSARLTSHRAFSNFMEETLMKKHLFTKTIAFVLSVTLLLGALGFSVAADSGSDYKPNKTSSTLEEMRQLVGTKTYAEYIADYRNSLIAGLPVIKVDVAPTTRIRRRGKVSVTTGTIRSTSAPADRRPGTSACRTARLRSTTSRLSTTAASPRRAA